jgi:uncharacterized protein YaiE (UPF0345 family)
LGRGASIQGFRGASSNVHSLDFYTYNSADVFGMRLNSSGDLGIGTTSPSYKLDVQGNGSFTSGASTTNVFVGSAAGNGGATVRFLGSNTQKNWMIGNQFNVNGGLEFTLSTTTGGSTFTTPSMVIDSSGNLGIGTSSPSFKLQVAGTQRIQKDGAGYEAAMLSFSTISETGAIYRLGMATGGNFTIGRSDTSTTNITLDSSGNLGIGTSSPAYRLDVAWDDASTTRARLKNASSNSAAVTLLQIANNLDNSLQIGQRSSAAADANESFIQNNTGGLLTLSTLGSTAIRFITNSSEKMRLDASGNLGIGTSSPAHKLDVSATGLTTVRFTRTDGVYVLALVGTGTSSNGALGMATNDMVFLTNGAERARITSGGNLQVSAGGSFQVGGTAARATTAGTNRVDIFDGTAPVGTLANGVSFYSTAGEARVMDAAGNATLLSPHDTETNEWIFHSKHTPTGKVLRIDVERLLRFVNDHFGLDAVQEFVEA